jgi:hypothetical protein
MILRASSQTAARTLRTQSHNLSSEAHAHTLTARSIDHLSSHSTATVYADIW